MHRNESTSTGWRLFLLGILIVPAVHFISARPDFEWTLPGSRQPAIQSGLPSGDEIYRIELTAKNNRWHARYPGATAERIGLTGQNLHVPCATRIVLVLRSADYVYTLAVPQFGLREIAVPNLEFQMEFGPAAPGRFTLVGDHLCGGLQPAMEGQLIVEPRDRFLKWLMEASQEPAR